MRVGLRLPRLFVALHARIGPGFQPTGGTILYELPRGRIHNFDDDDELQ